MADTAEKSWWTSPSTWAPQRGSIIFSRDMDWVLMAAHENGDPLNLAAARAWLGTMAASSRQAELVRSARRQHWKAWVP